MEFIKKHIILVIICIFNAIGLVGFIYNPEYFKTLTPINLLLSTALVLITSKQTSWKFYAIILLVALLGFFIEVLGVKTDLIFGTYRYGDSFGYKLFSVPLLIGVNWVILLYGTSQIAKFKNPIVNALFGSFLMVLFDFFIEQSCAKYDFWYWKSNIIPMQNYIAWFIFSFFLNMIAQKTLAQKPNNIAKLFYFIQLIFFATLYFFF